MVNKDGVTVGRKVRAWALAVGSVVVLTAAGCGPLTTHSAANSSATTTPAPSPTVGQQTTVPTSTTTTTVPCALNGTTGAANTVPINEVCSSSGAPHFDTPQLAMAYLASAWNADNVQELDYVTDPAGRAMMDSMASLMVDLQFKSCTQNPAGDYTCYFMHDITPSTSPTTYPNPEGYPPGEAVFTVAPAQGPGWYLTEVQHCG